MMEFINKCIDYVKANLWLGIVLAVVAALIVVLIVVAIVRSSKKKRAKQSVGTQATPQRNTMDERRAAELQANAEARAKKAAEDKARHDAMWAEVEAKLEAQRLAYEKEHPQETPTPIQDETAPSQADDNVCVETAEEVKADESVETLEEETVEEPVESAEERIAREKAEIDAQAAAEAEARAEELRIARAKAEAEKLAIEQEAARAKAEEERIAREKALAEAKAKAEAAAAAKAEEERIAREQAEAEAKAKAEAERIARAKAAAEKLAIEQEAARAKAAAERAAKEKAEAEAKAKAEEEARAKAEAERIAREQAEAEAAAAAANKGPELYEELKDAEMEDEIWYDENETDIAARYKGKWLICRMITEDASEDEMFFFELHASNGEKLLSSEEYTSYAGAVRGIETHKANIAKGNFKITLSKKGDYIFKLLSGKNLLLCMGENYPTRARCERAIESTKRFAETAVLDENVQDHVVKVPVEDGSEVLPIIENGKGKWIVSATQGANGEDLFYFELFASNGEKLLCSEEYTTYIGAINGIATHKANIEKDNFRISLTKRGDYIYKLLNGNGQLLCLGEHYKTKRLCKNAVDSVKRFAMTSPVLTDAKMLN